MQIVKISKFAHKYCFVKKLTKNAFNSFLRKEEVINKIIDLNNAMFDALETKLQCIHCSNVKSHGWQTVIVLFT